MKEEEKEEITVFKTNEADSFVKAIALLDESEIGYRTSYRNEGGYNTPRRIHEIFVLSVDAESALSILEDIPTETFTIQTSDTTSHESNSISRVQRIILAMVILFGIIMAILLTRII